MLQVMLAPWGGGALRRGRSRRKHACGHARPRITGIKSHLGGITVGQMRHAHGCAIDHSVELPPSARVHGGSPIGCHKSRGPGASCAHHYLCRYRMIARVKQLAARRPSLGFTLIELMITIAIVAILASIAIPSYRQYIIRGKRSAAKAVMMDIAIREQQFLLANRVYADTRTLVGSGYE